MKFIKKINCVKKNNRETGFTLTELLIVIAIIGVAFIAILGIFISIYRGAIYTKSKITANAMANEQMEKIRNMTYNDIATDADYPPGAIPHIQNINKANTNFKLTITVSYVDDPYDGDALGTIPNKPVDIYPYDYKKVEVRVSWANNSVETTSNISPAGPETSSDTGTLLAKVVDANGNPVQNSTLKVVNTQISPQANVTTYTDNMGSVMVPLLLPDTHYNISATLEGYSTDSTSPITAENPSPTNPDASIQIGAVTQVTLSIDKLSTLNIKTVDLNGVAVGNIPFQLNGTKLIGNNPNILKYQENFTTDGGGNISIPNLEWDGYNIAVNPASGQYISSTAPTQPVSLLPDSTLDVKVFLTTSATNPIINSVSPNQGSTGEIIQVTINGSNFANNCEIKLIQESQSEIVGQDITVTGSTVITVSFNLTGAPAGTRNLYIKNPNGEYTIQADGFTINE